MVTGHSGPAASKADLRSRFAISVFFVFWRRPNSRGCRCTRCQSATGRDS